MTSTNVNDPRRDTADQAVRLWEMGWTVRRIAKSLDVSTQRVYQILNERNLPDRKATIS